MKFKHVLACLVIGAVFTASTVSLHAANYTIQPGDTLSDISSKTGMSVQEIMEANGITDANKIIAGNSLTLTNLSTSLTNNTISSLYELFDAEYYASENPDVVAVYGTSKKALYQHFVQYGMIEGRSISPDFNVNAYRCAYPDLQNAFGDDISKYYEHYFIFGQKENRTLVTTEACIASGITVYDFDGKVIAAPVVTVASPDNNSHSESNSDNSSDNNSHSESSSDNSSDNDSAGDLYWLTGTWYCVETEINADGVMQSQGHFPYELYQLTDNEDGTFSYYGVVGHGAWIDGEFNPNPFDLSAYTDMANELYSEFAAELNASYSISEYCHAPYWQDTSVPLGIYDEGCVHLHTIKITEDAVKHTFIIDEEVSSLYNATAYVCSECNWYHVATASNTNHIDNDNDYYCDICGIYYALHDFTDNDSDDKCDLCGAVYYHNIHQTVGE